jgi:hypothetical protein
MESGKKSKKNTDELKSVLKSIEDCRERFYGNPCYIQENEVKEEAPSEEHSKSI